MRQVLGIQKMHEIKNIRDKRQNTEVLAYEEALSVFSFIRESGLSGSRFLIVSGPGLKGAAGLFLSEILNENDIGNSLFLACRESELSPAGSKAIRSFDEASRENIVTSLEDLGSDYDALIDAFLDPDQVSPVGDNEIISFMNDFSGRKIALEVPSGVDDRGQTTSAFKADLTLALDYEKVPTLIFPGRSFAGQVRVVKRDYFVDKTGRLFALENRDSALIGKRKADSFKGSYGKVLVIAGSRGMAGAAYFAGRAAYLAGAGLVRYYVRTEIEDKLQILLPEATVTTYDKYDEERLASLVSDADSIIIGPGLEEDKIEERIFDYLMTAASCPIIIDAGALNILSKNTERLRMPHPDIVITPHPGEMARLMNAPTGYVRQNVLTSAQEFSRDYNVITVLKGASTIVSVPFGNTYFSTLGNDGMAVGGSGDILTGLIGGAAAFTESLENAVISALVIHSEGGNIAADISGHYSMTARDIIEGIRKYRIPEIQED